MVSANAAVSKKMRKKKIPLRRLLVTFKKAVSIELLKQKLKCKIFRLYNNVLNTGKFKMHSTQIVSLLIHISRIILSQFK